MSANGRFIRSIMLLLTLAGCENALQQLRDTPASDDPQRAHLIRLYLQFSEREAAQYDWLDSAYFAEKGLRIARGEPVVPEDPKRWGIEQNEALQTLLSARGRLLSALEQPGSALPVALLAQAIFAYDCWVEEQEEDWQTAMIADCKKQLDITLASLENGTLTAEAAALLPAKGGRGKTVPLIHETALLDDERPVAVELQKNVSELRQAPSRKAAARTSGGARLKAAPASVSVPAPETIAEKNISQAKDHAVPEVSSSAPTPLSMDVAVEVSEMPKPATPETKKTGRTAAPVAEVIPEAETGEAPRTSIPMPDNDEDALKQRLVGISPESRVSMSEMALPKDKTDTESAQVARDQEQKIVEEKEAAQKATAEKATAEALPLDGDTIEVPETPKILPDTDIPAALETPLPVASEAAKPLPKAPPLITGETPVSLGNMPESAHYLLFFHPKTEGVDANTRLILASAVEDYRGMKASQVMLNAYLPDSASGVHKRLVDMRLSNIRKLLQQGGVPASAIAASTYPEEAFSRTRHEGLDIKQLIEIWVSR